MRKQQIFLILSFLYLLAFIGKESCLGQVKPLFLPVESKAPIPEDFRTLSSEKYQQDLASIDKSQKKKKQKVQSKFYLQSNFIIDDLLLSGKVLFNDSFTTYLNEVADVILSDDEELRTQLSFYVVRSGAVNAFATNQGNIFVNLGMFAKVENEAQLAFILCHEIVHYIENHALNRALVSDSLNSTAIAKNNQLEKLLLAKSNYSKEQESEADIEGLKLYLSTPYAPREAIKALELLSQAGVPGKANWGPLEEFPISFPDTIITRNFYSPDSLPKIDSNDLKEAEVFATHPTIDIRISTIKEKLAKSKLNNGSLYAVGESHFKWCQEKALDEICHIFLLNRQYLEALFLSAHQMRLKPEDDYYRWVTNFSLYGIAKYGLHSSISNSIDEYFESLIHYPPSIQAIGYSLSKLEAHEIASLSLYNLFLNKQLHVSSHQAIKSNLLYAFIDNTFRAERYLSLEVFERDSSWVTSSVDSRKIWLALGDDESFKKTWKIEVQKHELKHRQQPHKYASKNVVTFIDPAYYKFDLRNKEQPISYLNGEKKQIQFIDQIHQCADILNIRHEVISPFNLQENSIESYNELSFLKRIASDITFEDYNVVPVDYDLILNYLDQKDIRYLALAGVFNLQLPKEKPLSGLAMSLLLPPYLPFYIHELVAPRFETGLFTLIYDLKNQSVVDKYLHYTDKGDSDASIKSAMYYSLQKLLK